MEAERRRLDEARAALERERQLAEKRTRELEQARLDAEREAERVKREAELRVRELERSKLEAEKEAERLRREREEAERAAAEARQALQRQQEEAKRHEEQAAKKRQQQEEGAKRAAAAQAAEKAKEDELAAARRAREEDVRKKKEEVEKRKAELEDARRKRIEADEAAAAAEAKRKSDELAASAADAKRKVDEQAAAAAAAAATLAPTAPAPAARARALPAVHEQYDTIPLKPKPAPKLPPGWEQHTTEEGEVYFYNAALDESSWVLPTGGRWTRHLDDNGDVYFYNAVTDESKWELTADDEALLDDDQEPFVPEAKPTPQQTAISLPARPRGAVTRLDAAEVIPVLPKPTHLKLPPSLPPAAPPAENGSAPTPSSSSLAPPVPSSAAPRGTASPKLGARPPTEKKRGLFGKLKDSIRGGSGGSGSSGGSGGGEKQPRASAVQTPTPAVAVTGAPRRPKSDAEQSGKLRKWAKYRKSLDKAQVGLSDYVVRYRGESNPQSVADAAEDRKKHEQDLAVAEKQLASAREMQTKFAVLYASNPTERAKLDSEVEDLTLRVEQLKALVNPPSDLSPEELLQAALRAPIIATCRAKWRYDVVYDGELGFEEGDVIEVIEKVDDTWWHGRLRGQAGMFSCDFVEELPR